jgi:LmbE family N-acetylglucosaminyl deacetylase
MAESRNILVIAPHPDDESIGCGGTLCRHTARGDRVAAVFLTSGELGLEHLPREEAWRVREGEAEAAAEVLGLADLTFLRRPDWFVGELGGGVDEVAALLRPILAREAPQSIYLPHDREWHPDHRAALAVVRAACRDSGIPAPDLLTYEVWTPLSEYDQVKDITSVMARKLRAVRCYRSQLAGFHYDRAVRGLNQYRGALAAQCRYAEVFRYAELQESGVRSQELEVRSQESAIRSQETAVRPTVP